MALWSPQLGQKGSSFGNIASPRAHNRQQFSPQKVSQSWHNPVLDMEEDDSVLVDETILASLELKETNNCTSHLIFHYASQVFNALTPGVKSDRLSSEDMVKTHNMLVINVKDSKIKRKIYDLAFDTLKYQSLLEEVLMDSGFYSYDAVAGENHGLIMVIVYELINSKFVKRVRRQPESCIPYIQEVEDDLLTYMTKLNASVARNRIKYQASSLELLLPEVVRERDKCGSQMPCYAWVNQILSSVEDVIEVLREEGFRLAPSVDRMVDSRCFIVDHHCPNVLMFSAQSREEIQDSDLVGAAKLVLQDKTCCLGPHSVKAMLNEGDDIIHTNVGNGWTTAHLATLSNPESCTIYAYGVKDDKHLEMLEARMLRLKVHNVKFQRDDFLSVVPTETRYKNVKVVLVTPKDSRTGITNPVEFLLQEEDDPAILRELSQDGLDFERIDNLAQEHMEIMKHALKFYRVQAVVYATASVMKEENENVVARSAEYTNSRMGVKNNPYRPVPPVLPLSPSDLEQQTSSKFLRVEPSNIMGGCFVAVLSREDEAMSATDVLARAAAKGLCDLPELGGEKKKRKSKLSLTKKPRNPRPSGLPKPEPRAQPSKKKTIRTASAMFAHHQHRDNRFLDLARSQANVNVPESMLFMPRGVPLTAATIIRLSPKVEVTPIHKKVINHPKPFR